MNLGKCYRCGKTSYQMEGFKVGPPGQELVVHKGCFTCQNEGCTWKLDMRSYYYFEGRVYCKNHNPMTGFSNDAHARGKFASNVELATAAAAPKQDVVMSNVISPRGGGTSRPDQGVDMVMKQQINAPKKDVEKGVGAGGGRNAQNFI